MTESKKTPDLDSFREMGYNCYNNSLEYLMILVLRNNLYYKLGEKEGWYLALPWLLEGEPHVRDIYDIIPFSSYKHPDVCVNCFSYYGETISGRLRYGCPFCQNSGINSGPALYSIQAGLCWHPKRWELFLSHVIKKYLMTNNFS